MPAETPTTPPTPLSDEVADLLRNRKSLSAMILHHQQTGCSRIQSMLDTDNWISEHMPDWAAERRRQRNLETPLGEPSDDFVRILLGRT